MDEAFPTHARLAADWRQRRPLDSMSVRAHLESIAVPEWGVLGQAIDHRLRYAFSDSNQPASTVVSGMELAIGRRWTVREALQNLTSDLCADLARVIDEYRPSDRERSLPLPAAAEERLLRLCYVMSWFEAFYRNPARPAAALASDDPRALTLNTLLAAVPDPCIIDLTWQVSLAAHALDDLREATLPGQVRTGPEFAGTDDVQGADADLIVDDTLIDVKAKVRPSGIGRVDLRQLLGYVLLDYDNEYGINHVGFYLSRYGALVHWAVADMLELLGAAATITELRASLSARFEPIRERRAAHRDAIRALLADIHGQHRLRDHASETRRDEDPSTRT